MSRANRLRARLAGQAVAAFLAGQTNPNYEESLIDLLANLGHFADQLGLDYRQLAAIAIGHWQAEKLSPHDALLPNVTITIES